MFYLEGFFFPFVPPALFPPGPCSSFHRGDTGSNVNPVVLREVLCHGVVMLHILIPVLVHSDTQDFHQ